MTVNNVNPDATEPKTYTMPFGASVPVTQPETSTPETNPTETENS